MSQLFVVLLEQWWRSTVVLFERRARWLCVFQTRHSRPMRSWLQTVHVALVCGTRCGCMVVYVRVGRTMLRRLRLALLVSSLVVAVGVEGGPGYDASPMRRPRSPYLAFQRASRL